MSIQVWADVGGTFTDCIVTDDSGTRTLKLLSSGVVRCEVKRDQSSDALRIVTPMIDLPDRFFDGAKVALLDGESKVAPGGEISVRAVVRDPEGGTVRAEWVLRPESGDYATGGDFRPKLPDIEGAVREGDSNGAKVRMPDSPGAYRLFFYAYDEAGNAATANLPLLVKGQDPT